MHLGLHVLPTQHDLHDRMLDHRTAVRVPAPRLVFVSLDELKDGRLAREAAWMHNQVSFMVVTHFPIIKARRRGNKLFVLAKLENVVLVGVGNPPPSDGNLADKVQRAQIWGLTPLRADVLCTMFPTTVKTRALPTIRAYCVIGG